jgi:pantetheine-phosphate adenylyltransferase
MSSAFPPSEKVGLYAGSFDPWTFGHQFVLDSALEVFNVIHVVSAINPAKQSHMKPAERSRVIAHAVDPFCDWWTQEPPFYVSKRVIVSAQDGLTADYAAQHNIKHLIRGLRSTTDFEAEFNLYFANQAINPQFQTWAIMCPPRLLHCSSTYVKTVVGKPHVKFVGSRFASQALMLEWNRTIGQIFDIIEASSLHRFDVDPFNLNSQDLAECLQLLFSVLHSHRKQKKGIYSPSTKEQHVPQKFCLTSFLKEKGDELRDAVLLKKEYPEHYINKLWAILAFLLEQELDFPQNVQDGVSCLKALSQSLGRTPIRLFHEMDVIDAYREMG